MEFATEGLGWGVKTNVLKQIIWTIDVWLWLQAVKIIREIMHSWSGCVATTPHLLMEWSFSVLKQIKNYISIFIDWTQALIAIETL